MPAIDYTRIVMALLVVALHGQFLQDVSPIGEFVLSDTLSRVAVPWFFIVSGFYFRNENFPLLIKWVKRLSILYIIWTILYIPYYYDTLNTKRAIRIILFGYNHLWFLAAMLQAGIILYFLQRASVRAMISLAIPLLVTGLIIQAICVTYPENPSYLYRNFLFVALPFMLIGRSLSSWKTEISRTSVSSLTMICVVSCLSLVLEAAAMRDPSAFQKEFYVSLIVAAPAIFALCLRLDSARAAGIARIATGIYLLHPMVLMSADGAGSFGPTIITLIAAIAATAGSFMLTPISKRAPLL